MSISHRKINNMIEIAVADENAFNRNKTEFESLCKKIYLIESSMHETNSPTKIISEIRDEILSRSIDFKEDQK